jgi:hypothetical protein
MRDPDRGVEPDHHRRPEVHIGHRDGGICPWRASISAHTCLRIFARAVAIHSRCSAPISRNARHSVGSDATRP